MAALDLQRILELREIAAVDEELEEVEPEAGLMGRLQKTFRRLYTSHVALSRMSVLKADRVEQVFEGLFGGRSFEDVQIPFAAVAVDIREACQVIITSGPMSRGVAASSAIAGIFPPVEIRGKLLIDGGYTSPVPVDAAQALGANVVIAVDVSLRGLELGTLANGVEVAMRSNEISLLALEQEQLRRADFVIPARGKPRHWSDYSDPMEAIEAGEQATARLIPAIRATLEERARRFL